MSSYISMNESLIPAFRDSVFTPLQNPAGDIIELGIDSIIENEAVKAFPILGLIAGVYKTGVNIHERNLFKQTKAFINEVRDGTISSDDLVRHKCLLDASPKDAEKEFLHVMVILGQQVDEAQSKVLGSFYKAFVKNAISWEKFCELSEANRRMFTGDYSLLLHATSSGGINVSDKESYQIDRLIALGLLKNQQRTGSGLDELLDYHNKELTINDPRNKDVVPTSFGLTFSQHLPKDMENYLRGIL